jgi:hypothetical protein
MSQVPRASFLSFLQGVWTLLLCLFLSFGIQAQAQEIEARAYSNAPIGINFASIGIGQASSSSYKLTTEAVSYTRILDVAGQSGKISLVLPYAQLSGSGKLGSQTINATSEGLSDPLIKASVNLYGAPALTLDQFKSYQQDLIIGVSLAASIPWGQYNNEQMINVGANRWFVQPGLGASKALGPWRFELAGAASSMKISNYLLNLKNTTCIVASGYIPFAKKADMIICLEKGRIKHIGKPDSIIPLLNEI